MFIYVQLCMYVLRTVCYADINEYSNLSMHLKVNTSEVNQCIMLISVAGILVLSLSPTCYYSL